MTVTIDINRALEDIDYAKKCYLEKLNGKNIDNNQISKIEDKYQSSIKGWQAESVSDQNEYVIEDGDSNSAGTTRSGGSTASTASDGKNEAAASETTKEPRFKGKSKSASKAALVDAGIAVVGTAGRLIGQKIVTNNAQKLAGQYAKWATADASCKMIDGVSGTVGNTTTSFSASCTPFEGNTFMKGKIKGAVDGTLTSDKLNACRSEIAKNPDIVQTNLDNIGTPEEFSDGSLSNQTMKETQKAAQEAGDKAAKDTGKSAGAIIGCLTAFATGTKYELQRPNKAETHELYRYLMPKLQSGDVELGDAQEELETSNENIAELEEEVQQEEEQVEAETRQIEAEIEEKEEEEQDLVAKAQSEEGLTQEEKTELNETQDEKSELSDELGEVTTRASEEIDENNEKIEDEQETSEESQETVDTIQDVASYAGSFDEDTKTMCIIESGSQALNAYNGAKSSVDAFKLAASGSWAFGATAWAYAVGAMGAAGAAMSLHGTAQQIVFASRIDQEIDVRENVQKNAETTQEGIDTNKDNLESAADRVTRASETIDTINETNESETEIATVVNSTEKTDESDITGTADNAVTSEDNSEKEEKEKKEELV